MLQRIQGSFVRVLYFLSTHSYGPEFPLNYFLRTSLKKKNSFGIINGTPPFRRSSIFFFINNKKMLNTSFYPYKRISCYWKTLNDF